MPTQRLPRTRDLGFNWKIKIKLVSKEVLRAMGCEGLPGAWSVDDLTIFIDKTISSSRKQETYWHELYHALADIELRARGGI